MEKSVGLVIFRESGGEKLYLLLHHPGGHWDFPKGHVQEGESEHDTARRELQEETGITTAEIFTGFRERIRYSFKRRNYLVKKQVIFYLARTVTENVTLSHEHEDYLWLPADEALKQLTFENSRHILRAALQHMENSR